METRITPDVFCTYTGLSSEVDTTIFFISGNPGLISYYHPFLSLLSQNLADTAGNISERKPQGTRTSPFYQIYGCSLGGFEIRADGQTSTASASSRPCDHSPENDLRGGRKKLYDLDDQIQFVQRRLNDLMRANAAADGRDTSPRKKVILVGHSVGAYIAMEILRRHREGTCEVSPLYSCSTVDSATAEFDIVGGVMLFPTVMDIAHSPSGQKLTVCGSI